MGPRDREDLYQTHPPVLREKTLNLRKITQHVIWIFRRHLYDFWYPSNPCRDYNSGHPNNFRGSYRGRFIGKWQRFRGKLLYPPSSRGPGTDEPPRGFLSRGGGPRGPQRT